jgi:large subunit ribosomal protein L4
MERKLWRTRKMPSKTTKGKEQSVKVSPKKQTAAKKAAPKKAAVKVSTAKKTAVKPASAKKSAPKKTELKAEVAISKSTQTRKTSVKVSVYDTKGKVAASLSLSGEIFDAKVNPRLMAQAIRVYLANQRSGTASTKTRGEVRGSTRKIYRQKGTGRARHGGVRAPIFVKGGVAHGPKPKDHNLTLSKKMRKASLFSALTLKLHDNELRVVSGLEKVMPKTKEMAKVLQNVSATDKNQKVLMVVSKSDKHDLITRSVRNITGVTYTFPEQLTTYEVLNNKMVLFMKDAIESVEKHFMHTGGKNG